MFQAFSLDDLTTKLPEYGNVERALQQVGVIYAGILIGVGLILFYLWFSNYVFRLRKFNTDANEFFRNNMLKIILLLLSLLYIPVSTSIFGVTNCTRYQIKLLIIPTLYCALTVLLILLVSHVLLVLNFQVKIWL
jgi:hypothetical protein